MAGSDEFDRLIDDAYGAALDEALWEPWSERAIEHFGGAGGGFVIVETETGAPRFFRHHRGTERALEEYWAGMIASDPQLKFSKSLQGSGVFTDRDCVDLDDPATADFLAWQDDAAGWRHHMTCYASLGDGRYHAGLSISRATAAGATPRDAEARLAALLPDFARAMQLGFCHAGLLQEAYWDGLLRDDTEAMMLLDERGRMLRMNGAMGRLVTDALGFDVIANRPQAARPVEDARLQRTIALAVQPQAARSGALAVTRQSGPSQLRVTIYPLPRAHRALAPAEAAALLRVVDPAAAPRRKHEIYRQAFDLTARQAELASLLMAGHSVESAAHDLGITVATMRLHLHRLLEKAQVSRQVDLVRLLSRL